MSTTTSGSTSDDPDIRIGEVGKIVAGVDAGLSVFIEDDGANTGGFLILVGQGPDEPHGYDNWVKDRDDLIEYFKEAGWRVDWNDTDAAFPGE